jgi:hypothetical protein
MFPPSVTTRENGDNGLVDSEMLRGLPAPPRAGVVVDVEAGMVIDGERTGSRAGGGVAVRDAGKGDVWGDTTVASGEAGESGAWIGVTGRLVVTADTCESEGDGGRGRMVGVGGFVVTDCCRGWVCC